jgi:hypothetical protein
MNDIPVPPHETVDTPPVGEWKSVAYPAAKEPAPRLADAVTVDLRPEPGAIVHASAANVAATIAKAGGSALQGWLLTKFLSSREHCALIEASPHTIWLAPSGEPADVTPSEASNKAQSCWIPAVKPWKIAPNTIFFTPPKISAVTLAELRQILAAKYVVKKYAAKHNLVPGTPADIDLNDVHAYCRAQIKDMDADAVFQFAFYELHRQRLMK